MKHLMTIDKILMMLIFHLLNSRTSIASVMSTVDKEEECTEQAENTHGSVYDKQMMIVRMTLQFTD